MKSSNERIHKDFSIFLGPVQLFSAGLRLILSELRWSFISRFKLWEIRQLKKHLQHEEQKLGKLVLTYGKGRSLKLPDSSETQRCAGHAALLYEEIEQLHKELEFRRRMFVEARKNRYLGQES